MVQAFIASYEADGGWATQSVVEEYANDALRLHSESYSMGCFACGPHCLLLVDEAMLPDPFDDTVAQSWLDAGGNDADPLTHVENVIVRSASDAFGHEAVKALGRKLEAAGQIWPAAKRYYGKLALLMLR